MYGRGESWRTWVRIMVKRGGGERVEGGEGEGGEERGRRAVRIRKVQMGTNVWRWNMREV